MIYISKTGYDYFRSIRAVTAIFNRPDTLSPADLVLYMRTSSRDVKVTIRPTINGTVILLVDDSLERVFMVDKIT